MSEPVRGATTSHAVRLEMQGHVALLVLDRPERKNAMTVELLDAFQARTEELARSDARAAVITGAGDAFSSGADFTLVPTLVERTGMTGPPALKEAISRLYAAFLGLERVPIPLIAAVNGAAIGGGLGLALLCDIRIVSETAKIAANFARLGIHPGLGISALLPRAVGYEAAAELLFTGDRITGAQAAALGLAREAVPQERVLPRALELAQRIAGAAPLAVRHVKRTLRAATGRDFAAVLELESFAQALLAGTEDASEGVQAMLAKREPCFRGR